MVDKSKSISHLHTDTVVLAVTTVTMTVMEYLWLLHIKKKKSTFSQATCPGGKGDGRWWLDRVEGSRRKGRWGEGLLMVRDPRAYGCAVCVISPVTQAIHSRHRPLTSLLFFFFFTSNPQCFLREREQKTKQKSRCKSLCTAPRLCAPKANNKVLHYNNNKIILPRSYPPPEKKSEKQ